MKLKNKSKKKSDKNKITAVTSNRNSVKKAIAY